VAGRWTACDPIDLGGGNNLFAYGAGNPVNSVDPSGREPVNTDFILNQLVEHSQALGKRYQGTSASSTALHKELNDRLPDAVKGSPLLITEAIIDPEGKIID